MEKLFERLLDLLARLVAVAERAYPAPQPDPDVDPLPDPAPDPEPQPEPQPDPEPEPEPEPEPAPVPDVLEIPAGMRRPGDIPQIGDDWSKGDMKLVPWQQGPHSLGNPALVGFTAEKAAQLTARHIGGKWNTGALQLDRPKRGRGRWRGILSSTAPHAVCALFGYDHKTGVEVDFEYIRNADPKRGRVGALGWALGVHMPLKNRTGRRGFGGVFVEHTPDQFLKPTLHEFELDEREVRFYVGGKHVGTVGQDKMPSDCEWITTSQMSLFASVEWHEGWAGWKAEDYRKGADMTVHALAAPGA